MALAPVDQCDWAPGRWVASFSTLTSSALPATADRGTTAGPRARLAIGCHAGFRPSGMLRPRRTEPVTYPAELDGLRPDRRMDDDGGSMVDWDEESVAAELLACEAERRDREPFTDEWPELDVDTGYRIQDTNLAKRLARGEKLVGVKLGLTSEAKQKRMGVYAPFVAWLTDDMILNEGDPVPQAKLIHPRIEPEIIFVMKDRLAGPGVTRESAMAAVETVSAGAEVIDSRYKDFRFRAGDVVADNASSGAWATGSVVVKPEDIDLVNEKVEVYVNGKLEHTGTGADVQGHPGEALALAANDLARRGLAIEAGQIVLTGGITDAVFAPSGSTVTCKFSTLGEVTIEGGA
jgi:2-oxo-3-hexenedioate decarboxylase